MDPRVSSVCVVVLCLASVAFGSESGPAYFVSNVGGLAVGDAVDYEARSAAEFSSHLLSALASAEQGGAALPQALLVLASSEQPAGLSHDNSARADASDALEGVRKSVELSPSSTVFTSVGHACDAPSVVDALLSAAEDKDGPVAGVVLGGACATRAAADGDVQAFVASWAAGSSAEGADKKGVPVLVYCLPARADGAPGAASQPGAAFLKAYLALQNVTSSFAAVLLPEALPRNPGTCSERRVLASSSSDVSAAGAEGALPAPPAAKSPCDGVCRTKAALWEAILVSIVLIIAVVAGLCCLSDLDTPTKFETPPETS